MKKYIFTNFVAMFGVVACAASGLLDGKEVAISVGPDGKPTLGVKFPITVQVQK